MKKIVYILLLVLLTGCNIAAGSYPYAEIYEIESTEPDIIKAIEQFKKENPEYVVPAEVGLEDGRRDEGDHWYTVYFYYKDDSQIIHTLLRPSGNGTTSFGLEGVCQGLSLENWRTINSDFWNSDDDVQKEKFEKLILSKIKANLKGK